MKAVLADASSAILLHKADLFDLLVHRYAVSMVASVFGEVTVDGRPGCNTFRRLAVDRRLTVLTETPAPSDPAMPAGLHRGERDTLAAFRKQPGSFLAMDDRRAAAVCRQRGLPYICALLFPQIGYHSGLLSKDARDRHMTVLEGIGRYSAEVIRYARGCRREQVAPFLP
jgi:predicted nucleic acid-binding protein